jgi:hypothetical protein
VAQTSEQIRMGQNVPMTISADESGRDRIVTAVLRDLDSLRLGQESYLSMLTAVLVT